MEKGVGWLLVFSSTIVSKGPRNSFERRGDDISKHPKFEDRTSITHYDQFTIQFGIKFAQLRTRLSYGMAFLTGPGGNGGFHLSCLLWNIFQHIWTRSFRKWTQRCVHSSLAFLGYWNLASWLVECGNVRYEMVWGNWLYAFLVPKSLDWPHFLFVSVSHVLLCTVELLMGWTEGF